MPEKSKRLRAQGAGLRAKDPWNLKPGTLEL